MLPVSTSPPDHSAQTIDETEQTYCYRHRDTPTKLRCSRCDRPICGLCATPASVGQHCPECVGEARRSAPKVKTAMQANAPVVLGIIVACVVAYILQRFGPSGMAVSRRFALLPQKVKDGEWWRLFSSMFLHSPQQLLHILFNMFVLYMYGPQVEQAFGHVRFALLYLTAGFAGSAASYTFGSCAGSVGASGAIFGVVGILAVYFYNRRQSAFVRQYLNGLLIFVGINLLFGLTVAGIDNAAHVGGLA